MHPHMLYILMYLGVGLGAAVTTWFTIEELQKVSDDPDYVHAASLYGLTVFLWPVVWLIYAMSKEIGQ